MERTRVLHMIHQNICQIVRRSNVIMQTILANYVLRIRLFKKINPSPKSTKDIPRSNMCYDKLINYLVQTIIQRAGQRICRIFVCSRLLQNYFRSLLLTLAGPFDPEYYE